MQERPQNFVDVGEDPEATLVTPRFDAEEARRAEPVVPLAETHARRRFVNVTARPRRGLRRSWPTALLAVVMLAAVAVGGVLATKVMRRPLPNAPVQTEAAPAPVQTADAPQTQEASPAPQPPREEASAKRPSRTPRGHETEAGMIPAQAEILRDDDEDSDDKDDERRGREKRRARGDDEDEKEVRKASKRGKGKAPRLVDVITGRP